MKSVILFAAALTLFSGLAKADQAVTPKIDQTGKPSLGIQYAYDQDKVWTMLIMPDMSTAQQAALPNAMFWNLVDSKSGEALQEWTPISKQSIFPVGTFAVSKEDSLFKFLPNMKHYVFAFSSNKSAILFHFDLNQICSAYPTSILDMTNSSNPKCEVQTSQLPAPQSEVCAKKQAMFDDYVKKGLLTCAIANSQLQKIGCESLDCK